MTHIEFPLSTGQTAKVVGSSEFTLSNKVRLNKVTPPMICGRRAWYPHHVLAVAKLLGKDTPEVRYICDSAVSMATN